MSDRMNDHIDDDDPILGNRIHAIESNTGGKNKTRTILIASGIALTVLAITGVIILLSTRGSFLPQKGEAPQKDTDLRDTLLSTPRDGAADSSNVHIQQGRSSYKKRYFSDAMAEFREVVESDAPDSEKAVALLYMGLISAEQGKEQEAVTYYRRALSFDKKNPEIFYQMASLLKDQRQYDEAMNQLRQSLELDPRNPRSLVLKGNIHYLLTQYDEAIESYSAALNEDKKDARAAYNLGLTWFKKGDEFTAVEYLKKAAALDSTGTVAARAYSRLGIFFTERNNTNLAKKYIESALDLRPGDADLHYNLALVYIKDGKEEKAVAHLEKAAELAGEDREVAQGVADAWYAMERYDKSLEAYQNLLKQDSRNLAVLARLGEIYQEQGMLDKALEQFRTITRIDPGTERARMAYLKMGNILDEAGRHDDAVESFEKAMAIDPKDDKALYNQGLAYRNAGLPEKAIAAWKKAAELNPDEPRAFMAMADYYYDRQFYDLAQNEYEVILNRWPSLQEAHFRMASIYYKKNELQYAARAFQRVYELNGKNDLARRAYVNRSLILSKSDNPEQKDEARRLAQKALMVTPGDPEALYALGVIYTRQGLAEQALETFYQVVTGTKDADLLAETYNSIGKIYYERKDYRRALQAFTRGTEEKPDHEDLRMNRRAASRAYEESRQ